MGGQLHFEMKNLRMDLVELTLEELRVGNG